MLTESYSKEVRRWIERVRLPSAQCQACLSDKSPDRDFIFTCELCQSSIHSKHYGREIDDPKDQAIDKWYCERCRMICEYAEQQKYAEIEEMKCHFCPNNRGILKRVVFNSTETIWLHPQCYTWPYPIIFQKNNRRIHYSAEYPNKPTSKFWVNFEPQAQALCEICRESKGHKIKCMYYTCQKYYHCSCAKTIGIIRDLQSMRFDNSETYIPPYCEEHLRKRIEDCHEKIKKYKNIKDEGKASHFSQMAATYTVQMKNMENSTKKYQQEEKIRKQMEYQVGENEDIMQDLSFEEGPSFSSEHSPEFYEFVFDIDYPKRTKPTKRTIIQPPPLYFPEPPTPTPIQTKQPTPDQTTILGNFIRRVSQNRPSRQPDHYSQPDESQWHSSQYQQFQEEDD